MTFMFRAWAASTRDGIPLIYNGQEAGNQKRLEFFEKDMIEWGEHPNTVLIKNLTALKENNSALWNGAWGTPMEMFVTSNPEQVFSFTRKDNKSGIIAVFNLSGKAVDISFSGEFPEGDYRVFKTGETVRLGANIKLSLRPWDYRIYIR